MFTGFYSENSYKIHLKKDMSEFSRVFLNKKSRTRYMASFQKVISIYLKLTAIANFIIKHIRACDIHMTDSY
jgi:hypothetical protein